MSTKSSPQQRVLITGGAGFIGTHLCRKLISDGHQVRSLDIQDPKAVVEGVEYRKGDAREASAVAHALENIEVVYHLAAIVSVALCQEMPIESYSTNLLSTVLILDKIQEERHRTKRLPSLSRDIRIIFASSSAVYGDLGQENQTLSEQKALATPISFYAAQKLSSEQAILIFHQKNAFPALIFRFFNVYGPGQDPSSPYSGVISVFSKALQEARSLRLNGGGTQTRDFVSVHDIVRALVSGLSLAPESCNGQPINLGSGKSITISHLATEMGQASGLPVKLENAPWRDGDVHHSCADLKRAQTLLGWKTEISLIEGLRELLAK